MRIRRTLAATALTTPLLATAVLALGATAAAAHPLGNLSVNTYDGVIARADGVRVDHVEDLAELPALAAVRSADTDGDGDGALGPAEAAALGAARCTAAAERTTVRLGSRALVVRPATDAQAPAPVVRTSPGQAGLPLLRLECTLVAALSTGLPTGLPTELPAGSTALAVAVAPVADVGWREITIVGDGVSVTGATAAADSVSDRLTRYPADLRAHQPDERTVTAMLRPAEHGLRGAAGSVAAQGPGPAGTTDAGSNATPNANPNATPNVNPTADPVGGALGGAVGGLTAFVEGRLDTSGGFALVALVAGAALLGAAHAAAPGHGKTVIAAAAIARTEGGGAGRRVRDALTLGGTVTAAHTTSVLVVGGVLAVAGRSLPGRLFPVLAVVSGVLVVALGVTLLRGTGPWRHRHDDLVGHGHGHEGHRHQHGQGHGHQHGQGHGHQHGQGHGHQHGQGHGHQHGQGHGHQHGQGHGHQHGHDHQHGHGHSHQHGHSHDRTDPEAAPPPRRGRRLLVGLGLAGGLSPSPTALLLLLGAVAAGRTTAGVLAVVAFGLGMATALTAVGLAAAAGRLRVARWTAPWPRLAALVPRLAGLGVVGGGSLLVVRGLAQVAGL